MSELILSEESAEAQLEKLFEYYEKEVDELGQEGKEALEAIKPSIIKGIRKGKIEFKEDDELGFCIIQNMRKEGVQFTYREMNGTAKLAMGRKKEEDTSGRCYALLGALSGEGESLVAKLKGPDLKRAERIGTLLLLC